ncbi:MAG: imidazole glycerol phosphate synthase subunit HisF [Acidimicrobiales bacterium]
MTLAARLIPCLDVRDGRVVKGVRFQGLRDAGDPVECALLYQDQGADEIVLLDISATLEGRGNALETVRQVRAVLSIPLTVGGGIVNADGAARLLEVGADKVSINTAAVRRPGLVAEIADRFGSQCTVVAVDAAATSDGAWEVVVESGRTRTGIDVCDWCRETTAAGAGEILLTSWDRDGTRRGYDIELISTVSAAVNVPVIASGGADEAGHLLEALNAGASAVLVASILHDGDTTVGRIKEVLTSAGVVIRK